MSSDESTGLSAASDRIRETAKWIIASFAAIGAALIAGTQLSGIGSIDSTSRLVTAALSAAFALAGVGVAIWSATRIATASTVSLAELKSRQGDEITTALEADPTLMGASTSVTELSDLYAQQVTSREEAFDAYYAQPSDGALKAKAEIANTKVVATNAQVQSLLGVASFLQLSRAFRRAVKIIFVGGAMAAVGIGFFVWTLSVATTGADETLLNSLNAHVPTAIEVQLKPNTAHLVETELGPSCTATDLQGTAISRNGEHVEVLTTATPDCASRVIELNSELATMTPLPPLTRSG